MLKVNSAMSNLHFCGETQFLSVHQILPVNYQGCYLYINKKVFWKCTDASEGTVQSTGPSYSTGEETNGLKFPLFKAKSHCSLVYWQHSSLICNLSAKLTFLVGLASREHNFELVF